MTDTVAAVMFFCLWMAVVVLGTCVRDLQKRADSLEGHIIELNERLWQVEIANEVKDYA